MTREERLELLKQIEKDIYVPSLESTFLDDAKSCAIHSAIEELEQEPRKGHWIIDTHKVRASGKKYETHNYSVHCDKCNYSWDYTTDKEGSLVSNFCPNCGAKMESLEVHYV